MQIIILKAFLFDFLIGPWIKFRSLAFFCTLHFLLIPVDTPAAELAFFKSVRPNGQIQRFEGLYSHVAIRFQNHWLHAHPRFGLQLTEDLSQLGSHPIILVNPNYPEPSEEFVKRQLEKKFNILALWDNPSETYCSKLAGQYLNIQPTKMYFSSKDWDFIKANLPKGQLGLSPSDVYWFARRHLNFRKQKKTEPIKKSCTDLL